MEYFDGSPEIGGQYSTKLKRLLEQAGQVPEPVDSMGQRIYGSTQFAGGVDQNLRRSYPNIGEVAGGYFKSYDDVAKKLGYGDDAGVYMAAGGGIMNRGNASKLGSYRNAVSSLSSGGPMGVSHNQTTAQKIQALLDMLKRMGG